MAKPDITKKTTIETFMKAHADMRVGVDAIAEFLGRLNDLSASIVKAAAANARAEGRTTIMAPDITKAMSSVTGSTSDLPFLFKQLEALDAKDTATLAEMIQTWLNAH